MEDMKRKLQCVPSVRNNMAYDAQKEVREEKKMLEVMTRGRFCLTSSLYLQPTYIPKGSRTLTVTHGSRQCLFETQPA